MSVLIRRDEDRGRTCVFVKDTGPSPVFLKEMLK